MAFCIKIISVRTPVAHSGANRGETQKIDNPEIIESMLKDSEGFSDDDIYCAHDGNEYTIEDLIDQMVTVQGREAFIVED